MESHDGRASFALDRRFQGAPTGRLAGPKFGRGQSRHFRLQWLPRLRPIFDRPDSAYERGLRVSLPEALDLVVKEQSRNNFRFLGDWAAEETAINRHVLWTSINLGSVIFGLQRRHLLTAMSEGRQKSQADANLRWF
jgi:hypothetical protein